MPKPSNNDLPRDQYQHSIPEFILSYFQDAQMRPKNRKERQENFHKARKTGIDHETILMYDTTSQTFETRPISKVDGVVHMHLYRDETHRENVDHLEQGLSRLDNSAARIVRDIHKAAENNRGVVQMTRRQLGEFRKFVYLMHYRRVSLIDSYFDENDPENKSLKEWIISFKSKNNIKTKDGVWLYGLKYILETPHHKLVAIDEAVDKKYGPEGMMKMMTTRIDPDVDFHAVDYASMASSYFLGIWEAAEGEEFVMCSNSFGLWEGKIEGTADCHRLFVVSPRIALVLRNNLTREDTLAGHLLSSVESSLIDVRMNIAACAYADRGAAMRDMSAYRQAATAQEDVFSFTPTKLTPKQTHAFNLILLLNMKVDGTVTFASTSAMRRTLQHHLRDEESHVRESKYWVRSLLGSLNSIPAADPSPRTTSEDPTAPSGIDVVLRAIANGTVEFRSAYDRAYRVYHLATDDVTKYNTSSSEIHRMTARAIFKMKALLPPLPIAHRDMYFPFLCRNIVKELPNEESELFFALVGHQVDLFEVGPAGEDELSRIKYEAAIIGFTHWFAENRPFVLVDLLRPWVDIVL